MSMKWKEWVEEVERQMKEQGVDEDSEIFYIDTHMPDDVEVSINEHGIEVT